MFDRHGNTQRVRALIESSSKLQLDEVPPNDTARAFNPYDRSPVKATPRANRAAGGDPYSSGPALSPEDLTFNPYARPHPRKP